MKWIDKLERKFGRFAVNNLMIYLIIFYIAGFLLNYSNPDFYMQYLCLNAEKILHGQVWRIVTFLIYPPDTNILWVAICSYIYYLLGKNLETLWGTFRFNLFIIIGILGTVLASILIYLIWHENWILTANNIYMGMILGLAITVPEMKLYIYGLIPVKVKWLGIFYLVIEGANFALTSTPGRLTIVLSLMNVAIYYFLLRRPVANIKQAKRRREYHRKMEEAVPKMGPRHRCAVCGITEKDNPQMEFRFCSRCAGTYEYCMDHLYTHIHVTEENSNHQ